MITASICTVGDEILIGQVVDTNSSNISLALGAIGVRTTAMLSIGDDHEQIVSSLTHELMAHDIVIVTGGLGPTKDDITKKALAQIFGSDHYVENEEQKEITVSILKSRGLDKLAENKSQYLVPNVCEVLPNKFGTAPVMVFRSNDGRFGHDVTLYSMPGVPHEAVGMMPYVTADIKAHNASLPDICHRSLMVYGIAESALSKMLEPWETSLPSDMHLAYLPDTLKGIRLRLSIYGEEKEQAMSRMEAEIAKIKEMLGDHIYADKDTNIESTIGDLLRGTGKTLSVAESCTGGEISHLLATVSGSSEYYLGSVTSYAIAVKENVLGVPAGTIEDNGVVSSEVAAAMAEGVRRLTGSTYAVATTGLADAYGDERNPAGTVWIGVTGPHGTVTERKEYHNDRKRNIERFAASALDLLRRYIQQD